jgi:flagellar biosynthesis protein
MPAPDKRQEAVALSYARQDGAPRVVAKGRGMLAEEIIERAKAAGVFVHESPELVSLLMQVDLDERIPPALYIAVAELLAWLYRLEQGEAGLEDAPAARKAGDPVKRP